MNRQNRSKLFFRAFFTILAVLALVVIGAFCTYMLWEKAPDISDEAPAQVSAQPVKSDSGSDDTGTAFNTDRQDGVYTVLLVGNDDGNGNTDTIIVGKIDTVQHKMDFVSIPRDTLVNISWNIRKINAVYWGTVNSGGVGIDGLRQQVKNLLGFDVDCYAVIDLNVFIDTVDALGGIYFDVPCDMDYEDSSQNLYIHVKAGYQLLDGETAMGVVRFRSGYANGDLGRVEMQQKFLKAAASQFITLGNIPNISKVTQILGDGMDTNLSAANIAFFLRQALQCKSEDINFYTLPNSPDMVQGFELYLRAALRLARHDKRAPQPLHHAHHRRERRYRLPQRRRDLLHRRAARRVVLSGHIGGAGGDSARGCDNRPQPHARGADSQSRAERRAGA